jgi:hypothetical protein
MALWENSMIRKGLSLVTAAGILYVYLQSQLHSTDALFLVTSDNLAVNAGLVSVAGAAVYISFMERFKTWRSYLACASASAALGLAGFLGIAFISIENSFSGAILPLDYIMIMLLGIILGICSLSYQHQPLPKKVNASNLFRFRMPSLRPMLSAWIPQSSGLRIDHRRRSGPSAA